MNASNVVRGVGAVALVSLCAACSTWNGMSRNEKATTTGAVSGGVLGAAVGGPVGAAVGAGVGGYVGHEGGPGAPKATASNTNGSASSASSKAGMSTSSTSNTANAGTSSSNYASGAPSNSNLASMPAYESRDTIRSVQQNLNDHGYNAGPVDGIMGPRTRAALKEFQQANGLKEDGRLDQQTLAALGVEQSSPQELVNQTASNGASYSGTTEHAIQQSTGVSPSNGNNNANAASDNAHSTNAPSSASSTMGQ